MYTFDTVSCVGKPVAKLRDVKVRLSMLRHACD
jgi:hypothetical protein